MKKAIPDYKITELCRLFEISMSSYYYRPVTPSLADIELMLLIKSISVSSGNTYGKRRIGVELNEQGNDIGLYKTHWVGDITYIRTYQGWSYLACVLDLATKEVVGYSLSTTPNARLAKDALDNAIKHQQPNTYKLMFHSDQGVQYSAKEFRNRLSELNITQSMSRRGNCWDTQFTIPMTSHRSDPCWDWLICLRVDLSTGVGVPECYRAQRL